MELLYSDSCCHILLLEQDGRAALRVDWQNHASGELLQRASVQGMLLARRYRVNAWISDDRELGTLNVADLHWAEVMLESMRNDIGIDRFALIMSDLQHNRQLLRPLISKYSAQNSPLELGLFDDVAQAQAWALN